MIASGMFLASTVDRPVTPSTGSFPVSVKGRLEGMVRRIVARSQTNASLVIDGTLDRQDLPRLQTRTFVRVRLSPSRTVGSGEHVVIVGNFRAVDLGGVLTDERALARSLHVQWIGSAGERDIALLDHASSLHRTRDTVRARLFDLIDRAIANDDNRALLRALILGDATQIPHDVRSAYTRTGTIHMLCVSGTHIALISSILLVLTTWIRRPLVRAAVCCICIGGFVLLTGADPPALRAGLTGILMITGLAIRRHVLAVNMFGASVLLMLLASPELIHSYSFLLSTVATATLLFVVPFVRRAIDRLFLVRTARQRLFADLCALNVTVSTLMSLPVYLWFGTVAPWSPLANMIVVPTLTAAMITGMISMALASIHPVAGWCAGGACELSLQISAQIVALFDAASPGSATAPWTLPSIAIGILGLVWACMTTAVKHACVRASIAVTVIVVLQVAPYTEPKARPVIISREWCVAIAAPLTRGTLVLVQDRRPHQQPWPDRALSAWIATLPPPIMIATTGPSSIAVSDDVRATTAVNVRDFRMRELLRFHRIVGVANFASQL
jgi:competence protein ComEC